MGRTFNAVSILLALFLALNFQYVRAQEPSEVIEEDLGVVHFTESPKTWTVDIPQDFLTVEVGVYGKGKDEVNQYGGWDAYLKVNGEYVWKFVKFDNEVGGIIKDYIKGEEVKESSGKGKYLDVTSMVEVGENTITYSHYTGGDGIGVKIRIHTGATTTQPVEPEPSPEPEPSAPPSEPEPKSTVGQVMVHNVLAAETELYNVMKNLVAVDIDGYIATYSKFFADIMIDYYNQYKTKGKWFGGGGGAGDDEEESLEAVWELFVNQVWSSTKEAMSRAGLEVPPAIDAYLGPDAIEFAMKRAAGIESGTHNEFLKGQAVKYGVWLTCYASMRWGVYAESLGELEREHLAFQEYWRDKNDNNLVEAFGTSQGVIKFIEILEKWAQRFQEKSLKEYAFKSDSVFLADSPTGQVARAAWEFAQGIDSYDSRGQWVGKREINKLPRSLIGVNYFKSCKSVWSVIDVIGKAIPAGDKISRVVDDIGFTGGYVATLILSHFAMEQDIANMSDILSELYQFSEMSVENPGQFAQFVDGYYASDKL